MSKRIIKSRFSYFCAVQLPVQLIHSLQGIPGFEEPAFTAIHQSGKQVTSLRLNPLKTTDIDLIIEGKSIEATPVGWAADSYYLSERPSFTFDPLFHAGCYYVQEASSMFVEQALKQSVDLSKPLKVLDLCAAPGGKSTLIQSLLTKDSLLVTNEVIRQRVNILKDNIIKWGCDNVVVTNNDPKDFSKLPGFFDVIVVDAPCSGSGLFRRDEEAIEEWSENNVMLCSQRQQRILADVLPALKEGGVLIYSTCSYSKQEDEDIIDWISEQFQISNLKLAISNDWGITEVETSEDNYGYRFWPNLVKGEGFFLAVFRNEQTNHFKNKTKIQTKTVSKQLLPIVSKWADVQQHELVQVNTKVYAWPKYLFDNFDLIVQNLRVIYSGTLLGEQIHQKLIPDHALAMSNMALLKTQTVDVDYDTAIMYLQKDSIVIASSNAGWQLLSFKNKPLGWVNILSNRVNNYYPKELRILKRTVG